MLTEKLKLLPKIMQAKEGWLEIGKCDVPVWAFYKIHFNIHKHGDSWKSKTLRSKILAKTYSQLWIESSLGIGIWILKYCLRTKSKI